MSRRDVFHLALMGVGLAALVARAIAVALSDLDSGLRNFRVDTPDYVPLWMDEEADL